MGNSGLEVYLIIIISLIVFKKYLNYSQKQIIKNSRRLNAIKSLNEKYKNKVNMNLNPYDHIEYALNSKAKYDKVTCDNYFQMYVENNIKELKRIIPKIEKNKQIMESYESELKKINNEIPSHLNYFREKKLIKKEVLKSIRDYHVKINLSYTSPAGRNSYNKHEIYDTATIKHWLTLVEENIKTKSSRQMQIKKERALMSSSLRFEILERDNFTCQTCGSKAEDGVKLHIDHIYPVSKGGKTVKDNLHVLCDRCNLGKSDRVIKTL